MTMPDSERHQFLQHGAKTRSFCAHCGQPASYEGHFGGTEPMQKRVSASMEVVDVTPAAKKRAGKKAGKRK